jgi:aminoglycoside 6-adenylyltransferase
MLFADGNRIDLTLFPADKLNTDFKLDSLTIVWLDKDNLFTNIEAPCEKDYLIKPPNQKAFSDACNEFWWVCTYVSKGLLRNRITYAKAMLENPVRQMFMQMTEWYIGTKTNFSVSFGKGGKYMHQYMPPGEYNRVLTTYADYRAENNWHSLFVMTHIFQGYAQQVAEHLKFSYNDTEQQNIIAYLHEQYNQRK